MLWTNGRDVQFRGESVGGMANLTIVSVGDLMDPQELAQRLSRNVPVQRAKDLVAFRAVLKFSI